MDDPLFRGEPFCRRSALEWLVSEAAFEPRVIATQAGEVHLARGQLSHSLRYMAKAWRWDEAKVRRFLKAAENAGKIVASTDAGQTVITICNCDIFLGEPRATDAAPDAATTHPRRGDDAKNKEGKKERRKEEEEDAAIAATERYAFEGRTIRINRRDLDAWQRTYHAIPDIVAELTSLDAWFEGQPPAKRKSWFHTTAGALNRKHQELLRAASSVSEAWASPC